MTLHSQAEFRAVVVMVVTGILNQNRLWLPRLSKAEFGYFNIRLAFIITTLHSSKAKSSRTRPQSLPGMFWFATNRERDVFKKTKSSASWHS